MGTCNGHGGAGDGHGGAGDGHGGAGEAAHTGSMVSCFQGPIRRHRRAAREPCRRFARLDTCGCGCGRAVREMSGGSRHGCAGVSAARPAFGCLAGSISQWTTRNNNNNTANHDNNKCQHEVVQASPQHDRQHCHGDLKLGFGACASNGDDCVSTLRIVVKSFILPYRRSRVPVRIGWLEPRYWEPPLLPLPQQTHGTSVTLADHAAITTHGQWWLDAHAA